MRKLLAGHDAIASLHEGGQQLKLTDREAERLPVDQGDELAGPDLEPSRSENRCCLHGPRGCHPRDESPLLRRFLAVKML